ncbi:MAG: protein kinase, partial [Myxococcota bacterium]
MNDGGRRSRAASLVHAVGDLILGRYRVEDIVGSGGTGVVYRARHTSGAAVAVKIINAKLIQSAEDREHFTHELERTRTLVHENVLEVIDAGFDSGRPYIVTPFLEGLSLRRIIDLRREKGQVFTVPEVDPIAEQLALALEALRTIPVVHGDLKPENVLVLPDVLKVTDLGLFAGLPHRPFLAIQRQRGNGWRYLAPEVRTESGPLGPAADLYSLGVIVGEMLTGVVFDEGDPDAFLRATQSLPHSAQSALMSVLATAPLDRPAAPEALVEGLRGQTDQGDAPTQRVDLDLHALGRENADLTTPGRRRGAPPTILREEGRRVPSPPPPPPPPDSELPGLSGALIEGEDATVAALDAYDAFGALEEMSAGSVDLLEEPGLILVSTEEKARIDELKAPSASPPAPAASREAPRTTRSAPPVPDIWGGRRAEPSPWSKEEAPTRTSFPEGSAEPAQPEATAGPWDEEASAGAEDHPIVAAPEVTTPERPPAPVAEPVTRVSSSDILDAAPPSRVTIMQAIRRLDARRFRTLIAVAVTVAVLLLGS